MKKNLILGIDEAGRGCLAGPVYVAGVITYQGFFDNRIRDSKKLSPLQREESYKIIHQKTIWQNFYYLSNIVIDNIGIAKAIYLLMNQIYQDSIDLYGDFLQIVYIDGNYNPIKKPDTISYIKADDRIPAVSAASIIAKVERDRFMEKISIDYPAYSFSAHKGYGTKLHIQEIMKYGYSPIHRTSFKLSKRALQYAKS